MIRMTRAQVREVDRRSIEEYHIPGIVLMENASRAVAEAAAEQLAQAGHSTGGRVLILCGGGNNGGDGLAAARHLHNACHVVLIGLLTDPAGFKGDARINSDIARAMNLHTFPADAASIRACPADLIVDAIFGTGLTLPPRDPFPAIIDAIHSTGIPVLAVDIPSGLDCDTGRPLGTAVRASRTVTFVAEKAGFADPVSKLYTGRVTVADIGCPRELADPGMAGWRYRAPPGRPP